MTAAAAAVEKALEMRSQGTTQAPKPSAGGKPDESDVVAGIGVEYIMTHATSNLDSRRMENGQESPYGPNTDFGAVDISAVPGTAVYAPEDGKITKVGSAQGGDSITFEGDSGQIYWLGHITDTKAAGSVVKAGTQIAAVFDMPGAHLHFAGLGWYAGTNPAGYSDSGGDHIIVPSAPIMGSGTKGGSPNVGGGSGKGGGKGVTGVQSISPGAIRDIAAQTFFTLQTGGFDQTAAQMLQGERALSNDISLME